MQTNATQTAPTISTSAMLVELNISTWSGRKLDKQVSAEIDAQKHTNTIKGAGNYNKKLFADEPTFEALTKYAGTVRTYHYFATMPWSDSGLRLLPTSLFFDYQKQITDHESKFRFLMDNFYNDYDNMVARAYNKLGALFNQEDYPDRDSVIDRFRISAKYLPVPEVGDFRVNVGNEALEYLKQSYEAFHTEQLNKAYADAWERTYEALKNMSTKLAGDNKQIFRDTLVTNVRDMTDLLEKFNITDDENMRRASNKIKDALLGITPDALREDDYLRLDTKAKVDAILKEFTW
jgi:hypothetical protein